MVLLVPTDQLHLTLKIAQMSLKMAQNRSKLLKKCSEIV
jgi:hypothetical protein